MEDWAKKLPKLGFGLMRLPRLPGGDEYDTAQLNRMVDAFLAAGQTYFDTAYVYDDGRSEAAIKKALVDRYPRESFQLATKICSWSSCTDAASAQQQFYTSLARTGAGYFDCYLLHSLTASNAAKYDEYGLWDFAAQLKEKGLVKHWGFSFHDSPQLLDELLTKHPEADFVQLQINYADWESPTVASRANYETVRRHGKPVIVMEPVKGGTLADPPARVKDILTAADKDASPASWAIRFAASLDDVAVVLSGMSSMAQMEDNLSYMRHFAPLTQDERATLAKAQQALSAVDTIPCTACRYCMAGCPQHIAIPRIFAARNLLSLYGDAAAAKNEYGFAVSDGGKASDCIACGQCERNCPQHIDIIARLQDCAATLE